MHPPAADHALRTRRLLTSMLYAQPASVHFGGFELERSVQQRVRVYNNSSKAVRLRYTFPSGRKGFRATFVSSDRPSFVSAGLCEEILVSFTPPAGFQYYYDCIQVQCEEVAYGSSTDVARSGATLIPLHAYPIVNEVTFPSRMDFGAIPRGTCDRKFVDLTCSVPVEFEYEIRLTKSHPAFIVYPLQGAIPSRGEARIEIEFRPQQYATASAELELHISQLGFTPRVCVLVGSSSSTVVHATSTVDGKELRSSSSAFSSMTEETKRRQTKLSKTRILIKETKSQSQTYAQDEPQLYALEDDEELETVQGIEIPRNLNSVNGITFVLNQEPGKRKLRKLKQVIAVNRALQHPQQDEQAKLRCDDEDTTTLSFKTLVREEEKYLESIRDSKQIKDMYFHRALKEAADAEKRLEFQSDKVHLGQRLLSRQQLSHLTKLREMNYQAMIGQQREQLRTMFHNVRYETPINSNRQYAKMTEKQPLVLGELTTAVLPAHFVPAFMPDFKPYKNDLWARRQRALRRLVRAVSTCILRLRAQKRLNRIRLWLDMPATKLLTRGKAALDWGASLKAGDSSAVTVHHNALMQKPSQVSVGEIPDSNSCHFYLSSFPVVEEITAPKLREKIDVPMNLEFKAHSFTPMALKPRDEALLMGHEPLQLPALPTYVPLEEARVLRQGAKDECGVVASLLLQHASSKRTKPILAIPMPSLLEILPRDVFLRPQASVRPLVELEGSRETEASYALRPRRVFRTPLTTYLDWQNSQVGLKSIMESHDEASLYLSDVFVCSTDKKQVEVIFSCATDFSTNDAIFGDVWNVTHPIVPPLAERAEDVPNLSDSESDEDGDNGESLSSGTSQISWKRALELFEDQTDDKAAGTYEDGELLGRERGVYSFERYRHSIRQERAYNSYRHELLERLPKLLDVISAQIEHPDYALVVRGHGLERPLHNLHDKEHISM